MLGTLLNSASKVRFRTHTVARFFSAQGLGKQVCIQLDGLNNTMDVAPAQNGTASSEPATTPPPEGRLKRVRLEDADGVLVWEKFVSPQRQAVFTSSTQLANAEGARYEQNAKAESEQALKDWPEWRLTSVLTQTIKIDPASPDHYLRHNLNNLVRGFTGKDLLVTSIREFLQNGHPDSIAELTQLLGQTEIRLKENGNQQVPKYPNGGATLNPYSQGAPERQRDPNGLLLIGNKREGNVR